MDGNHRDTSLGLILASVSIQALLLAGVAAGIARVHAQAGQSQFGPPGAEWTWTKPMPDCSADGGQYGAAMPGAPMPRARACGYSTDPNMPGQPVTKGPCCGDGDGDYSAP